MKKVIIAAVLLAALAMTGCRTETSNPVTYATDALAEAQESVRDIRGSKAEQYADAVGGEIEGIEYDELPSVEDVMNQ